ncbi:SDR family NAD(P)-dependent oxidoreductase [Trinickia sp. YCB016]
MKSVILITGAGTGIGKLSAQALAEAGHFVYATMRDVEGRNKSRADALRVLAEDKGIQLHPLELDVLSQDSADAAAATIVREKGRIDGVMDQIGARLTELTPPNADPQAVADEVVRIVGLERGARPMRSVIDFVDDGAKEVLEVSERVRIEFAKRIGMGDLLTAKVSV